MAKRPFSIRVDDKGVRNDLMNLPRIAGRESQDVMMKIGKVGELELKRSMHAAGATPFARVRSKYGVGPANARYRTGNMLRSIGYVLRAGAKQIQMAVGYINGKPQDYYAYQDQGFINKWRFLGYGPGTYGPNAPRGFIFGPATARVTEGTHGLRNAKQEMIKERDRLMKPLEKRIARSMNKK